MNLSPTMLALGALAFLLGRGGNASAAPAPSPAAPRPQNPPTPRPTAAKPAAPSPSPAAKVAPPPSTLPWPGTPSAAQQKQQKTELAILNKPATASTKKDAIPAFNVHREDGSAPQTEMAAVVVRKNHPFDNSYWMPAKKASKDEQQKAKSYLDLGMWKKGGVWFDGPNSFAGARQYRAVMHGQKKAIEMWVPKPPFK